MFIQSMEVYPHDSRGEHSDSSLLDTSDSDSEQTPPSSLNLANTKQSVNVSESSEITVGSRLIFEEGSSVTIMMAEGRRLEQKRDLFNLQRITSNCRRYNNRTIWLILSGVTLASYIVWTYLTIANNSNVPSKGHQPFKKEPKHPCMDMMMGA